MNAQTPATAVGVFSSRKQVDEAIADLKTAGFADEQIGIGAQSTDAQTASGPPTWSSGAAVGGLSGASLGGLAAGPVGAVGGALVGVLWGALIDLEVPEQDARWYADQAAAGHTIVTVRTNGRYAEAHEILLRHGGSESPVTQITA
jgi:outer membrane lipoprotein SlyB